MGWIQIANFVVTGPMVVACAVGFRRTLRSGPAATSAPRLLPLYSMGLILAGIFVADPMNGFPPGTPAVRQASISFHGMVHMSAAGIGFLCLIAAWYSTGGLEMGGDQVRWAQRPRGAHMKIGLAISNIDPPDGEPIPRFGDFRAMAQRAEEAGFDSVWLADHLLHRMPGEEDRGFWEAFTFLSALTSVTSRIHLGSLVACTSFRHPTLLAKMADSLDEISNGRFVLGLGAGWHEPEYHAFGYPFDHRIGRFEEAVQIIVSLLRTGRVSFDGQYYQADDAVLLPRGPSRTGPPWS